MSQNFVLKILEQVFLRWFGGRTPLERVLKTVFKENHVGSRDRRIIRDFAFNLVRFRPDLIFCLENKENPEALRLFQKQISSLTEKFTEKLTEEQLLSQHFNLKPIFEIDPSRHLKSVHGLSQELLNFLDQSQLPMASIHQGLHAQLGPAPVTLRASTRLAASDLKKIQTKLLNAGFLESKIFFNTYSTFEKLNLEALMEEFQIDHDFFVQDESSQMVAHFMATHSGARILDFCAGAGGKSFHLAEVVEQKCQIDAWEVNPKRRHELKKRASILKIKNLRILDRPPVEKNYDSVLVDAPCSGWGTLRRQPDLILRTRVEDFEHYGSIQSELLKEAGNFLRPGGMLTYSTCSFLESENSWILSNFLKGSPNFQSSKLSPLALTHVRKDSVEKLTNLVSSNGQGSSLGLTLLPQPSLISQGSGGWIGDGFFIGQVQLKG